MAGITQLDRHPPSVRATGMLCLLTSALAIDVTILRPAAAGWKRTQCGGATGTTDLPTKWASQVSPSEPPLPEYPRPTLVRSPHGIFDRDEGDDTTWRTLNGLWEWQPAASATAPPPFGICNTSIRWFWTRSSSAGRIANLLFRTCRCT
jgi:hypothetical protein